MCRKLRPFDLVTESLNVSDDGRAAMPHLASRSRLACEQWGSGTGLPRSARPRKMARSARSGASARIICSCSTSSTFDESFRNTLPITMRRGRTFRSGRTRPADGQSNNSETLSRIQSLADYTIDTLESSFQKQQLLWCRHIRGQDFARHKSYRPADCRPNTVHHECKSHGTQKPRLVIAVRPCCPSRRMDRLSW